MVIGILLVILDGPHEKVSKILIHSPESVHIVVQLNMGDSGLQLLFFSFWCYCLLE